jgi:hypothetical protein
LRVIGVDPGEKIGWARLGASAGVLPEVVAVGAWNADAPASWGPFGQGDVVAIERAEKPHPASLRMDPRHGNAGIARVTAIVKGILVASWIGGRIAERAEAAGARVVIVTASDARRAIGVVIGGGRRGIACETCSGSGAGLEGEAGVSMAPDVLREEAIEVRERAAELLRLNGDNARGKKKRMALLKAIRLKACASYPCPTCHGSGERKAPSVDQQVAQILPALVSGWPDRSSVHARDAAVAALQAIKTIRENGEVC